MDASGYFKRSPLVHEFKLVYAGPSFEQGIKLESFIDNLESLRKLIYSIADVAVQTGKGNNSGNDIHEVRIIPKKGSVEEQIIIFFKNPEVRSVVVSILTGFIFYLWGKWDAKTSDERMLRSFEELVLLELPAQIKKLFDPLQRGSDKLLIVEEEKTLIEIPFSEKEHLENSIEKIESQIQMEEQVQTIVGYISAIDIDTKRVRFHPRGEPKSFPLDHHESISLMTRILARDIRARIKTFSLRGKIRKGELLSHQIIQLGLDEFKEK